VPRVILKHVLLVRQQVLHDVLRSLTLAAVVAEVQFADQEEAYWPDPLRPLVVVVTARLIIVVVVALILAIRGVQSFDTHRTLSHKHIFDDGEAFLSLHSIEEFGGDSHRDAEIGPQLVVSVAISRFIAIFVDTSTVNESTLDVELRISLGVDWHIEALSEACFDQLSPSLESDLFDTGVRELTLIV